MTREEALKILKDKIWPTFGSNEAASVWLDSFVELGMLKLEEPKSAEGRLYEELNWPAHGKLHTELHNALYRANLKIVEK